MLSIETNQRIHDSHLNPVDKLAVRTAIASLELLRQAAQDLGCPIEQLDDETLTRWIARLGD